ncbi:hypothetical protein GINT2_001985 [Glugoides intestinalis]
MVRVELKFYDLKFGMTAPCLHSIMITYNKADAREAVETLAKKLLSVRGISQYLTIRDSDQDAVFLATDLNSVVEEMEEYKLTRINQ